MDDDHKALNEMAQQLFEEVWTQGYGAALPSALSDAWLLRVKKSCEKMVADMEDGRTSEPETVAMLTMLVMKTLHDRGDVDLVDKGVPVDALQEYMELYRTEVHFESLRRKGLMESSRATVADIFDPDRDVHCSGPFVDAWRRGGNGNVMN